MSAAAITIGQGRRRPQGQSVELDAANPGEALGLALSLLRGADAWWSAAAFVDGRRHGDAWRAQWVIGVDVDYHAHDGQHARTPFREALRLRRALSTAPCTWAHLTPRGARLIALLDAPIVDRAAYLPAWRALVARAEAWLPTPAIGSLRADPATKDLARFYFAPRATVDGSTRRAALVAGAAPVTRLAELFAAPLKNTTPKPAVPRVERATDLKRARAYVAKIDPSISLAGGQNQTFHTACQIVRMVRDEADQAALLDEYNERCQPPWSAAELAHKLHDARATATFEGLPDRPMASAPSANTNADPMPGDDFFAATPDAPADESFGSVADHVELGTALVAALGGSQNVVFDELAPWSYDEARGLFARVDAAAESRIVQGFSGAMTATGKPLKIKAGDVAGAIKLGHDQVAKPDFFANAPRGLSFRNGFVSISDKGATLHPHARENRARAGYPFDFETGAPCPQRFLEFLYALFRDDADRVEKEVFVQEFFGACLAGIAPLYQRCVIGEGKGDNGKSRLADIMTAAMPDGTTSAIAPQSWGQEYYRAALVGKRLNAVGELPERDIIASESFKAIVAGDPIFARVIRESPVMFRPIAGHYFAANKLPGTQDQSEGFWRRFVVLTFNRSFTGDPSRDPNVHTRILSTELPAIVAWLVAGAVRLLGQRDYTIPPSHARALATWRKDADQVALFLMAETRPLRSHEKESAAVLAADLYSSYVEWTRRNGHRPVASNTFGARLRGLGHAAKRTNVGMRYLLAPLSVLEKATLDGDEAST